MQMKQTIAAGVMLTVVLACGCRIESNKHGESENVRIATPFGGMQVKTNDAAVLEEIGLPAYPGAELVKKKDKDSGSADVNFSFGDFKLRVKAASYRTGDSPDKVAAFYRKELGRYGDVIQCANKRPVGSPTRTAEGLTCDDEKGGGNVNVEGEVTGKMELKAGSAQHQHIVALDPDGNGTKFGLVALDLPGHITFGSDGGKDAPQQ